MPFGLVIAAASSVAIWPTSTVISAVKQVIADPRSIFAERSPGERDPGALSQTKEAYPILNDASGMPSPPADMLMEASPLPTGEEEPKAFMATVPTDEAGNPLPGLLPASPVILVPSAVAPGDGPGETVLPNLPILGGPPPPPVILALVPPPGTPIVDNPGSPPTPAVPEPASWATMIVGFLTVGTLLRRRPRAGAASDRHPSR